MFNKERQITHLEPDQMAPEACLRSVYLERQQKNKNYSLNAFARDLDLDSSAVSRILNGVRKITLKQGLHIAAVLNFTAKQTNAFILSITKDAPKSAKISKAAREALLQNSEVKKVSAIHFELERFKAVSQWYHVAIANLTFVKGFKADAVWIAKRLGISRQEAKDALTRLLELGLLVRNADKTVTKAAAHLYLKTSESETAVREFHQQMISLAQEELKKSDKKSFDKRLINGATFSCSSKSVPKMKQMVLNFQRELLALAQDGDQEELYQFNCQLFPLTKEELKK